MNAHKIPKSNKFTVSTEYLGVHKDFNHFQMFELKEYLKSIQGEYHSKYQLEDLDTTVRQGLKNGKKSLVIAMSDYDDLTIDYTYE